MHDEFKVLCDDFLSSKLLSRKKTSKLSMQNSIHDFEFQPVKYQVMHATLSFSSFGNILWSKFSFMWTLICSGFHYLT